MGEPNEVDRPKGYDSGAIVEENGWIGANATLLAGVTIGRGAILAAGSVITKDIPPYCVAAGVPAKVLGC